MIAQTNKRIVLIYIEVPFCQSYVLRMHLVC